MITVDLITGFLGSGKTTFLLKYARFLMNKGLKLGILEYDYGAINVDMVMLKELRCSKCEIEMVSAGCDDDCLKRRFKTKLIAMAMSGYDRVIIEPSGVFDMDMFFDTLRDDPLENWYDIGNIITIADGNLEDELSLEAETILASQAADAGYIVISRTQELSSEVIEHTKEHIRQSVQNIKCNKFSNKFMDKDWSEFTDEDYMKLVNCGYNIADYVKCFAGKKSEFDSVSFLNVKNNLEEIKTIVKEFFDNKEYGNIIRVKGYISDNGPCYEINAKRNATEIKRGTGQNVITVIGTDLDKDKIKNALSV